MASQDWFEKDFYAILGVPQDADDAAVKKAYRKQAREWHPDAKQGDPAAEKRFKDVGEAYAVLSDSEQRQQYDAIRAMAGGGARFTAGGPGGGAGFEDVFAQMFGGGGGGGGGGARNVRFGGDGAQGVNLEDLLGGFATGGGYPGGGYGAGSPFGHPGTRGPQRGRDVEARTTIGFREAAAGDTVSLQTPEGGRITVRIPAGVKDGQTIRLRGKGMPGDAGSAAGDLMLKVSVKPHPVFGRDGLHLTVDLPVTFAEAVLGSTVEVPTLDGSRVKVKIAPGTPSGRVLRVKGRGIQAPSGAGDLRARVVVVVPQRLTEAARAAVETLRQELDDAGDPRAELYQRAED